MTSEKKDDFLIFLLLIYSSFFFFVQRNGDFPPIMFSYFEASKKISFYMLIICPIDYGFESMIEKFDDHLC